MLIDGITTLLTDIGGVLLTNGWDRYARQRAARHFGLDYNDMDERHHLTFDTYEEGKLSLDEYLERVIFYTPRHFSEDEFKQFMMAQSQSIPDMLALIGEFKRQHNLKVVAVSNEGRELTNYRVRTFHLDALIDVFVASAFVHVRKPDRDIYQIALDMAQVEPNEALYIDDRAMFVEVARGLGLRALHHVDYDATRMALMPEAVEV
ncbi:MAG: HAD-IA family hydrolase [Caldilineaceae bacterium]